MNLNTKRLLIRPISIDDLEQIHELNSLPETDEYNTLGIPESKSVTEKHLQNWLESQDTNPINAYVFCIELISQNQFIGMIALKIGKPTYKTAEVWYKIHKDFWNQGYTTEALNRLLLFSFIDLKLHRIEAGCATENSASIRVLEKVGMQREGLKRKKLPIRGEWKDNYFYAILEEDFFANN